jgi:N-acetylglucosaminyldiphosphoundecaprenol N-acetyl-beta-D-mannosaminyltransferase
VTGKRFTLLGAQIQSLSLTDIVDRVEDSVQCRQHRLILYHNLHSIYLYHHDKAMAALYEMADYVYVDGMALVFLARLFGIPLKCADRTTFVDCFETLIGHIAHRHWRVFYLGSKPGVAARGAEILVNRFPGLQIATADGYFDAHSNSPENKSVLDAINTFEPHILFVGMGMPRQERWLLENLNKVAPMAIVTSGASMDYLCGEVAQPPRWAGPLGLYWFFRLVSEPTRLWRRYLLEPWYLLGFLVGQYFSKRTGFGQEHGSGSGQG